MHREHEQNGWMDEMAEQAEAQSTRKRTARIDADSKAVAIAVSGLLTITAGAAMLLSFQAHTAVAADRLGAGQLAWAYPISVDASLIGLAMATLVQARRGEGRVLSSTLLFLFTSLSATVNAVHILDITPAGTARPVTGIALGALLPLMVLALTEVLARTIFTPARPDSATEQAADHGGPVAVDHADSAPAHPTTQTLTQPADHDDSVPADHADSPSTQPATQAADQMPTQTPDHSDPAAALAHAEPTPAQATTRPAIQAVPSGGSKPAKRSGAPRVGNGSAVPEHRVAEVNREIDSLLDTGLSQQRIADELTDSLGLKITKARVSRRARSRTTQEVAA